MFASNMVSDAARTATLGDKESLQEVLDFLVTEEQLGVTLVSAAIEKAPGTFRSFLPVLRNGVIRNATTWRHSKEAGANH
jgi:hypothetical protein